MMKRVTLFLIISIFSGTVLANGTVTGQVKAIQVRETGNIEITLEEHHTNPDACAQAGKIVFENSFVGKKEAVSIALSAMAQGKTTSYYVVGCLSAYGTTYPKGNTVAIFN